MNKRNPTAEQKEMHKQRNSVCSSVTPWKTQAVVPRDWWRVLERHVTAMTFQLLPGEFYTMLPNSPLLS